MKSLKDEIEKKDEIERGTRQLTVLIVTNVERYQGISGTNKLMQTPLVNE